MRHTELKPNLVVVANGEPAIITKVEAGASIEVQLIDSKKIIIVDIEDLKFLPSKAVSSEEISDQCLVIPDDDGVALEDITVAAERFFVIEQFKSGKISLAEAMKSTHTKKTAFYALVKKYDPSLGARSLYPKKSGTIESTQRLPDETEAVISAAIEKIYRKKAASYIRVWEEVRFQCSQLKIAIPSQTTVTKRIKSLGERQLYRLKHGAEAANQKYGAKPGKVQLSRPLERVQMDHTLADVILVDDENRKPLFRPWITFVIDVFTRVILGYYVAFHAPQIMSVACAVTHAVLPKRRYLKNLGCADVLHPFYGVPQLLHMDNAREFRSLAFRKACAIHGIATEWRPLGRKHYGGHVERLIGTMMTSSVHFLPGTTMSNIIQKGDYDSAKNATMTIGEFTKWFAGEVEMYNYKEHSALKCSPAKKWEKSFKTQSGESHYQKLITDPFKFRLDFMPEKSRTVQRSGIEVFNNFYYAPEIKNHVGEKNITIKYDPFSLSIVWARLNNDYVALRFLSLGADDLSYEQYLVQALQQQRSKTKEIPENIIAIREGNEKIVKTSTQLTKKAKRNVKAKEAYVVHVQNQHFEPSSPDVKTPPRSKLDFTKKPQIFESEDF